MNLKENAQKHTAFYANWAMLIDGFISMPYETAITGPDALSLRKELALAYRPDAILLGIIGESKLPLLQGKSKTGESWIYVCKDKTCGLPVQSVSDAVKQMQ
jgi:hypothetical protein